jgi:hypothetical protein
VPLVEFPEFKCFVGTPTQLGSFFATLGSWPDIALGFARCSKCVREGSCAAAMLSPDNVQSRSNFMTVAVGFSPQ